MGDVDVEEEEYPKCLSLTARERPTPRGGLFLNEGRAPLATSPRLRW